MERSIQSKPQRGDETETEHPVSTNWGDADTNTRRDREVM